MKYSGNIYKQSFRIRSVLEIRLCRETWSKVQYVSALSGCSYSWVVRYAVNRFIYRKNFHRYVTRRADFQRLHDDAMARRPHADKKHRHRLCLYGRDEMNLRLSAVELGCTMTHLVRMALDAYLERVFQRSIRQGMGRVEEWFWFWLGIKLHLDVEFASWDTNCKHFNFTRYRKGLYFT